jgi:pimeloyl-ACP methyl ester carboxylesterase
VFVHGTAEDGRIWQPQLDALADEFTVIAWDEPDAGRSSDVPPHFGRASVSPAAVLFDMRLLRREVWGVGADRRGHFSSPSSSTIGTITCTVALRLPF